MSAPVTITPSTLPSLPLDEHRNLPDTAAIYVVRAVDTVLYIRQPVSLDA